MWKIFLEVLGLLPERVYFKPCGTEGIVCVCVCVWGCFSVMEADSQRPQALNMSAGQMLTTPSFPLFIEPLL